MVLGCSPVVAAAGYAAPVLLVRNEYSDLVRINYRTSFVNGVCLTPSARRHAVEGDKAKRLHSARRLQNADAIDNLASCYFIIFHLIFIYFNIYCICNIHFVRAEI